MKTLKFRNGDEMPILGLGTWKSGPGEVYGVIKEAIKLGYRHFDCAAAYGNEVEIGRALSECFAEGLVRREEVWITSKLWNDAHAPEDVEVALQKTLAALRVDALDLYLMHWPVAVKKGVFFPKSASDLISLEEIPLSKTWEAMENAVDKGLCRHIGVSNFSIPKLVSLVRSARIKPELNQIEMHPYLQQKKMLQACEEHGVLLTAYSPLGSGDRPKGLKAEDEPALLGDPVIGDIAKNRGITAAEALLAWSVGRNVSVIPKSTNPVRLKQNLDAAEIGLTDEEMKRIEGIDRHRRYIDGSFWAKEGSSYTIANLWDE